MKNIVTILLMLTGFALFAQNNNDDVIFLKNGTSIRGTIIEEVPDVSVKIKTSDGNVFVYKYSEIEKIQRKSVLSNVMKGPFSFDNTRSKGFVFTPEIGALIGVGHHTNNEKFLDFKLIFAGLLSHRVYLGAGFGLDLLGNRSPAFLYINLYYPAHTLMFPAFASVRYSVLANRISPFISQDLGYSVFLITPKAPGQDYIGGAMAETQIGLKLFISQKSAANISIGYRFQHLVLTNAENYTYYSESYYHNIVMTNTSSTAALFYHFITVHFGFTF